MFITRRQFVLGTAAGLIPASYGDKAFLFLENYAGTTESQHLCIRPYRCQEIPSTSGDEYAAEVLKDGNRFLYRARGATVPISAQEARLIVKDPYMYYFSTALKLHNRINRQIERPGENGNGESI